MSPLKIVIFEDEFLLANDIKQQIQKYNFEVIAIFRKAEDGLKFLQGIQQQEGLPDVVLMDISLAGKMNGIEAARIMMEKYDFALVFLTGMSQMGVFEEAFITRPHAFLIKPFDIQQALISIRLAFYQKSLENRLLRHQEDLDEKIADRTRELKLLKDQAEEEIKRKCALLDDLGLQVKEPLKGIMENNSLLKEHLVNKPRIQKYSRQLDIHVRHLMTIMENISRLKEKT